jgi:hypothetical protein
MYDIVDCLVVEAREMWLRVNNFKREERFKLSQAWNSTVRHLQQPDNGKDRPRWSKEECKK